VATLPPSKEKYHGVIQLVGRVFGTQLNSTSKTVVFEGKNAAETKRLALRFWMENESEIGALRNFESRCAQESENRIVFRFSR